MVIFTSRQEKIRGLKKLRYKKAQRPNMTGMKKFRHSAMRQTVQAELSTAQIKL